MKKATVFILGILCAQAALCQTMTVHRKDQTPVVVPMSQIDSITFSISSPSPLLCSDGIKNGDETDVDCGGSCAKCATNKICNVNTDCLSGICTNHLCVALACSDLVKNGTETDVDCGGSCPKCATGKGCAANSDCESFVCITKVCRARSCEDTRLNGDETDVDCGGSCVALGKKCADTKRCVANSDCLSGVCKSNVCQAAVCTDRVLNGNETDVDCGGSCTAKCAPTKKCVLDSDCFGGRCTGGLCQMYNTIKLTGGVRYWSDGTYALTCKEYRSRQVLSPYQYEGDIGDGAYRILNFAGSPIDVYCDMTTDNGGWMLVGKYADTSSYETTMRCRSNAAYGSAVGDPNSASPWADWRVLTNVTWPIEFAVILDQFTPSGWESNVAKVMYRVKSRGEMPNYGTTQDLVSGDNLQYKFSTSQAWTDVGSASSSANNTWQPKTTLSLDLTVFFASGLNAHGIYYGDGVPSGTKTWNHSGIMFVR